MDSILRVSLAKDLLHLINLDKIIYFRRVAGLPFDIHIKVSNVHERRHYKIYEGEYLMRFIEHCSKKSVVYDVGGHIGLFSLCAALSGGSIKQVLVFEPTPWNYSTLKENIKFNKLQRVIRPFQLALGSKNAEDFIHGIPKSGWGGSSFIRGKNEKKEKEIKIKVKIRKGDDLIKQKKFPEPSIIKIDVEGFEFEVLKGFENTFTKCKPMLFIEYHPKRLIKIGQSEADIHNYLEQFGYKRVFRKRWWRGTPPYIHHTIYI